jgi:hypothetical protein
MPDELAAEHRLERRPGMERVARRVRPDQRPAPAYEALQGRSVGHWELAARVGEDDRGCKSEAPRCELLGPAKQMYYIDAAAAFPRSMKSPQLWESTGERSS